MFWIEKVNFGPKKFLLFLFLIFSSVFVSVELFFLLFVIFLLVLISLVYFFGYNHVIYEFTAGNQTYRVVDFKLIRKKVRVRKLLLNSSLVSAINLLDPKKNEYLKLIENHVDLSKSKLTFLHLGGAGCSTPIVFSNLIKDSNHIVLEIEETMVEIAKKFFLKEGNNIKIVHTDAVDYIKESKKKFDYIVQDLFMKKIQDNEFFLSTKWFSFLLKKLKKDGKLLVNTSTKSLPDILNIIFDLRDSGISVKIFKHNSVFILVIEK